MIESSVQSLLAESFAVLSTELPAAWLRFCAALDGLIVELHVDHERFTVRFSGGVAFIDAPSDAAHARIGTSCRAILDVLDARLTLRHAVMSDALQVVGPLSVMEPLHDGILAYVHGGVRCPSFPALLKRFRALTAEGSQP